MAKWADADQNRISMWVGAYGPAVPPLPAPPAMQLDPAGLICSNVVTGVHARHAAASAPVVGDACEARALAAGAGGAAVMRGGARHAPGSQASSPPRAHALGRLWGALQLAARWAGWQV